MNSASAAEAALIAECVRVYRRYAIEIVEALTFCPYAERSRLEGRTREVVVLARDLDLEAALAATERIAAATEIEIGLVIWPRLYVDRAAFSRFVEAVRAAHQRSPGGLVMAMEGFHPEAELDVTSAERAVPFIRRTPDPTIQLVRHSVLERVRRGTQQGTEFFDPATMSLAALLAAPAPRPLHDRIAAANLATIHERSGLEIERLLLDILRDRDAAYAALGERPRSPA